LPSGCPSKRLDKIGRRRQLDPDPANFYVNLVDSLMGSLSIKFIMGHYVLVIGDV
jgi:hypothetical protein